VGEKRKKYTFGSKQITMGRSIVGIKVHRNLPAMRRSGLYRRTNDIP
jgi:hypothetical protein